MARHTDHISRSVYFEIRRISSIRHLLTTKATAQLMCSLVVSRLDGCNSLLVDINCDQLYRLQEVQNNAVKAVFRKNRLNTLDHCSRHSTGCQSEGSILKIAIFVVRFSHGTLLPYLSSCLSVYISSRTLPSSSGGENHSFLCKMET